MYILTQLPLVMIKQHLLLSLGAFKRKGLAVISLVTRPFKWLSKSLFSTPLIGFAMWLLIFSLPFWETGLMAIADSSLEMCNIPSDASAFDGFVNRFSEFPWLVICLKWLFLAYVKFLRFGVSALLAVLKVLRPILPKTVGFIKSVLPKVTHLLHHPAVVLFKGGSTATRIPVIKRQVKRVSFLSFLVHWSHEVTDTPSRLAFGGVQGIFRNFKQQMRDYRNIWFVEYCGLAWIAMYSRGNVPDVSTVVLFVWDKMTGVVEFAVFIAAFVWDFVLDIAGDVVHLLHHAI